MRALAEAGSQAVQLDVSGAAALVRLAEELEVETVGLSVLVNNIGYGVMGPLLNGGVNTMHRQFGTNVFTVVGMARVPFPLLRRKSGLVVDVGNIPGVLATLFAGAYCASKVAVHTLSDTLCLELAPFGVEVLEVQPSAIASNFDASTSREVGSVVDERSPWWLLRRQIQARAAASQDDLTPAEDFVCQSLAAVQRRPHPPLMRTGDDSRALPALARWLPRGLLE